MTFQAFPVLFYEKFIIYSELAGLVSFVIIIMYEHRADF